MSEQRDMPNIQGGGEYSFGDMSPPPPTPNSNNRLKRRESGYGSSISNSVPSSPGYSMLSPGPNASVYSPATPGPSSPYPQFSPGCSPNPKARRIERFNFRNDSPAASAYSESESDSEQNGLRNNGWMDSTNTNTNFGLDNPIASPATATNTSHYAVNTGPANIHEQQQQSQYQRQNHYHTNAVVNGNQTAVNFGTAGTGNTNGGQVASYSVNQLCNYGHGHTQQVQYGMNAPANTMYHTQRQNQPLYTNDFGSGIAVGNSGNPLFTNFFRGGPIQSSYVDQSLIRNTQEFDEEFKAFLLKIPVPNPNLSNAVNLNLSNAGNPNFSNAMNPNFSNAVNPNFSNAMNPNFPNAVNPNLSNAVNPNLSNGSHYGAPGQNIPNSYQPPYVPGHDAGIRMGDQNQNGQVGTAEQVSNGINLDGYAIPMLVWDNAFKVKTKPEKAAEVLFMHMYTKPEIMGHTLQGKKGTMKFDDGRKFAIIRAAQWLYNYQGNDYLYRNFDVRLDEVLINEQIQQKILTKLFCNRRNELSRKYKKQGICAATNVGGAAT